jgi:dCTP deaminase
LDHRNRLRNAPDHHRHLHDLKQEDVILSDFSIAMMLESDNGDLTITPPVRHEDIQPASIDVRLGSGMQRQRKSDSQVVRPGLYEPEWDDVPMTSDGGYILHPGNFYLGSTTEYFQLGGRTALQMEGKSSWGRRGLEVHSTAGWIDPGFEGQITLEMKVVGVQPVWVGVGMTIAQVVVFFLDRFAQRPYGHITRTSKYQGQTGPTGPR